MRVRALVVVAVAALVLAGPLVTAHLNDARPHVQSFQETRAVKAVKTDTLLGFDLDRPTDPTRDVIEFRFDTETAVARHTFKREEARAAPTFEFRWRFHELVEYEDSNGNVEFDPGFDFVVKRYAADKMRWTIEDPVTSNLRGQEVQFIVATGEFGPTDASERGAFSIQFVAHGLAFDVALARMHPQDVKMNWNYADFPFRNEQSRFALVTFVEAPPGTKVIEELFTDNITRAAIMTKPGFFAFADWATSVRGNSTREPVNERLVGARVAQNSQVQPDGFVAHRIVFSYPRVDFLLSHDPSMGFEYAPPERPPVLPPRVVIGFLVFAGLVGALVFVFWFKRRKGYWPIPGPLRRDAHAAAATSPTVHTAPVSGTARDS